MGESERQMDQRVGKSVLEPTQEVFVTGLAVVVPLLVSAIVFPIVVQYIHDYLSLFARTVTVVGDGGNGDSEKPSADASAERGNRR
jgi:hypothetical protein